MKTKRIVITGGPGTGKTTLIKTLEAQGFTCLHEISRQVILEAKEQGIDQLFLDDPILFSEKLLKGRYEQYLKASNHSEEILFYDRGMPDVTAYLDFIGSEYPTEFDSFCQENTYNSIYLLPPWKDIYHQDNERYESYEQAESIYNFLLKGYEKYGYTVHEVPKGPIKFRVEYILNHLNDPF